MSNKEILPQKKKLLLETAQKLMLKKGYTATSVEEICEQAGLTKGSFFHYFKSKEELGKAVLIYYFDSTFPKLQEADFNKIKDPLKRLYGYIDLFIQIAKNPDIEKSCLFGNFSQELSNTHPEIRKVAEEGFSKWTSSLKKYFDEAKQEYAPQARINTQTLAEHFISLYEGSLILVKAKQNPQVLVENMRHFRTYLEALFEEDKTKKKAS